MEKRYSWPEGHWDWPVHVSHKHGVRCGQMIWVGGQVDLTSSGGVNNPHDLSAQIPRCIDNFAKVLAEFGCDLADLVKLLCFYVNDGSLDEDRFLAQVAAALPDGARPAVTAIPVPYLAYPGMVVEIEGYAMRGEKDERLPRSFAASRDLSPGNAHFASSVRCGKMIFVSGQSPIRDDEVVHAGDIVAQTNRVMRQIESALGELGADFDDVVKVNRWYVGGGTVEDFEPAAMACANHFKEPGPAATGIPLPRLARTGQQIKIEAVAMLREDGQRLPRRHVWPESLWDWTIHLPYKHGLKCHDMIFLGGQVSLDKHGAAVDPGQMKPQTRLAMTHIGTILQELGADYADVCKITTMYEGRGTADILHDNLLIRSSFFTEPGPASTGIPLPVLAYPGMIIEIDAFAMAEPDPIPELP
ncbi:enamine deaminase RidA (YjgF/YER057c/UK114 family) [Rhodoligotrophos appendicifer]|uniref:Rid family hydrolase n=1 Tax=Rhodoligotrophos appendicifer TaxID=987056 RepID=UPI00147829A4|nr:Rid family hydrolase [Rhodoligotrophos appendicifer]